ncbi:MAG: CDP-glucose 4,6-dehydratase [Candidatus Gastranaerophilaceae bacterium]
MVEGFQIYKNKKVFLTGASGFKGSWLTLWLQSLGAEIMGYSLNPNTKPAMFLELGIDKKIKNVYGNILDKEKLEKTMTDFNPEIIFHLAAQPLVRLSYSEPLLTYQTNVIGTLNVLEAARKCPNIKAFVNVTTDKCYENKEINHGYKEDEPMGGWDMYSSSKGCVEIMSASYRRSFLQGGKPYAMATARAGNVIGGGDWALDRLIPDCIRAIEEDIKGRGKRERDLSTLQPFDLLTISIRNPIAIRPWQHVLEPLSGYLLLGQKLLEGGEEFAQSFNFGPNSDSVLTVADVAQKFVEYYGKGTVVVDKKDDLHEAGLLMLNIEKAKKTLGWTPAYSADEAIKKTVEWYKIFYSGEKMVEFTLEQIKNYERKIAKTIIGKVVK